MTNELLLIMTLIAEYSAVVIMYRVFGKSGLFLWTVVATIAANIEVLILVDAFGTEMTLGNVLFASTFLVTDVLSENYGKAEALKAVKAGFAGTLTFTAISLSWLAYTPSSSDFASDSIRIVFSNTPRMMIASLSVYVIVQYLDVWLYNKIWDRTVDIFGNRERGLWIRNNAATLTSQLINSILFNVFAFAGTYGTATIVKIIIASFALFIATSFADTPFIYIARKIGHRRDVR